MDYNTELEKANKNLETELETLKNNANASDRVNQYAQQDDIMLIYIQKIMTILYIIIYLIMGYVLYTNPNVSRGYFGAIILLFLLVPLFFWLIGKYFSDTLLWMVRLFISGNSKYLYI